MTSFQDFTFSTRAKDGTPRDGQRNKKENAKHVEHPERRFIKIIRSHQEHHFFHQDPGWDPKGQPKEQKEKRMTGVRNPGDFLLFIRRSHQDHIFSTRIKDGTPRGNQRNKKENVWQVEKSE